MKCYVENEREKFEIKENRFIIAGKSLTKDSFWIIEFNLKSAA